MNINSNSTPLPFNAAFLQNRASSVFNPDAIHQFTNHELIHGNEAFESPLLQAIYTLDKNAFDNILNRVGIESLRVPISTGNYQVTALQAMLLANKIDRLSWATNLFGPEVLMEKIKVRYDDIKHDFYIPEQKMQPHDLQEIPYLHFIHRLPSPKIDTTFREHILSLATTAMLTTEVEEGVYQGLTPVHLAFAIDEVELMEKYMSSSELHPFDQPAGNGSWEGLAPVHLYLMTAYIKTKFGQKPLSRRCLTQILKAGPVPSGPYQGYLPIHLAAMFPQREFLIRELVDLLGPECLTKPILSGINKDITALSIAHTRNLPSIQKHIETERSPSSTLEPQQRSTNAKGTELDGYTNDELIFGKQKNLNQSPLLIAIKSDNLDLFTTILKRINIESLGLLLNPNPFSALGFLLAVDRPHFLKKAFELFGNDLFLVKLMAKTPTGAVMPVPFLVHLMARGNCKASYFDHDSFLNHATVPMLTTGYTNAITPVHVVFITHNIPAMHYLMNRDDWDQLNTLAKGPYEGFQPTQLYFHQRNPKALSDELNDDLLDKLLNTGPVKAGEYEGYLPIHLVAMASAFSQTITQRIIDKIGHSGLTTPIPSGRNQGVTAWSLAEKNPNQEVLKLFCQLTYGSIPPQSPPASAPQLNLNDFYHWAQQRFRDLKQNPLPLITAFKESGLFDYSGYGDAFLFQNKTDIPFSYFKDHPQEERREIYRNHCTAPHPDGLLDAIAGAAYHLHQSLIANLISRNTYHLGSFKHIPFMVYMQRGKEVAAHIAMCAISDQDPSLLGMTFIDRQNAIDAIKEILEGSVYRFEGEEIVMDLEGFSKLTEYMKKPGLNLIVMPRMAEPKPEEEVHHSVKQVRPPQNPPMNKERAQDEPTNPKRKLHTIANTPKRLKVQPQEPAMGGVDRRNALKTGAITTRLDDSERASPPSKRVKQGNLETIPTGKTVEMPEIAFDETDPALSLKSLVKGSLEVTLNNLKMAQARSALIENEPLPMAIAERLSAQAPTLQVQPLTSLMGYQKDALLKILNLSHQGLMPLLSLEMGLGKTYVFREWILQQIMANGGGRHLIIVPASVKEQTRNVLQEALTELIQQVKTINRNQAPNTTGFSKEQLSNALKFTQVLVPTRKDMENALKFDNAILIVNYEIMDALKACPGHEQLTSLIADEAQRIHNDQSQTFNVVSDLAKVQKKSEFRPLMVTATPFENDLSELWTLLSLSNPGMIPEETQRSLTAGLQKLKENLFDAIQGEVIDHEFMVHVYGHYKAFQGILSKLVIYKKTTDPQVVKDWKGRVPTRQDEFPEVDLNPEVRTALAEATKELIQKKSQLTFNAKSNAALIHTSLIGQSIKDGSPAIQELYRNAEKGDIHTLIDQSSFLKLLFAGDDPILQRCYRDNMKALVFVDHYATGKLIQIGANRLFKKQVEFLNGQCSAEEKTRLTTWFEETKEPRVLVLSMKAGGVGLNLPSARLVVDLSQDYNIAQHYQAVARAIRANNEGEVKVLRPLFRGSFYQAHVNAHQEKKAKWMKFYFGEGSFNQFVEALITETAIELLNKTKNLETTIQGVTAMQHALSELEIDSSTIENAVAKAAYPVAPPPPPPPLHLDPRQYLQIPLPYGTSREDAIRIAKSFQNPEGNEAISLYMASKKAADEQRIPAESIRRADSKAVDNLASSCLRRALRIIENRQLQIQAEPLSGKDFVFAGTHFEATPEDQMDEGIYLYKKQLPDGRYHYEPLIARSSKI